MSCYWNGATGTFLPPILPVFFGMCYGCARTIAVAFRSLKGRYHAAHTMGLLVAKWTSGRLSALMLSVP